jgi:hypothetical protein
METEQPFVAARAARTPFKDTTRTQQLSNEALYRTLSTQPGARSIAGRARTQRGYATTLNANTAAAMGNAQAQNRFNLLQDQAQTAVNVRNVGQLNAINRGNLDRRNQRLQAVQGAFSSGIQNALNLQQQGFNRDFQNKALMLEFLKDGDIGVLKRAGININDFLLGNRRRRR